MAKLKPFVIPMISTSGHRPFAMDFWAETEEDARKIAQVVMRAFEAFGAVVITPDPLTKEDIRVSFIRPDDATVQAAGIDVVYPPDVPVKGVDPKLSDPNAPVDPVEPAADADLGDVL